MKYLVVGAGICGSSLARAATAAGHDVLVVDSAEHSTDSLAAAALMRRAWHKPEAQPLFDRSWALYLTWGVEVRAGAVVTSYRNPEPRFDPDWLLVDPVAPLWTEVHRAVARPLKHNVADVGGVAVTVDRVLWATGRHGPGVDGLSYGVTWVHDDPAVALVDPDNVRVHHLAPYKSVVAGRVGGQARFGSSSASTLAKAREQADHMFKAAVVVGLIEDVDGWRPVEGVRAKTSSAHLGGMHRTGYALAPAMAEAIVAEG